MPQRAKTGGKNVARTAREIALLTVAAHVTVDVAVLDAFDAVAARATWTIEGHEAAGEGGDGCVSAC